MSNMTLFKGSNLPSRLRNQELDDVTKSLMGGGGGSSYKRISIKGNVFRMVAGGKEIATNEDRAMNVVIVAAAPDNSRTYYEGQYKEGEAIRPACWSNDGKTPDKAVKDPQASTCASCPQNIKGSGQGDSRACRFSRRLAVVLEGDMEGDVYGLTLPATSIFGKGEEGKLPLQAYATHLANFGCPITAVVTEMRFDIKSPTPKLTFKPVRPLTDDEDETAQRQGQTADAKAAITLTVAQQDKVSEKDEEEFETVKKPQAEAVDDEPVKRSKKAAPVEENTDIAKILEDWGND
jgi:hypothetical protein